MLIRSVADDGLQLLVSVALVLGCYRLANTFELSGPIAVVSAGLCMGSRSRRFGLDFGARTVVIGFWSLLDRLVNAMLFLLIGLQVLDLVVKPVELIPMLFAIPLALVSRLASVAVPLALTRGKCRREGARYGGADLGRIARRHLGGAGAHLAAVAVADRYAGGDLCGCGVHHRGAGPDDFAAAAGRIWVGQAGVNPFAFRHMPQTSRGRHSPPAPSDIGSCSTRRFCS